MEYLPIYLIYLSANALGIASAIFCFAAARNLRSTNETDNWSPALPLALLLSLVATPVGAWLVSLLLRAWKAFSKVGKTILITR